MIGTQFVTELKSDKKLQSHVLYEFFNYHDDIPKMDCCGGHPGDIEDSLIQIYPSVKYQTWQGFGGSFTDSSAAAWLSMSDVNRDKIIKAYFSSEGIAYNYGRMHIGSCDFSTSAYSYIKEGDLTLNSFSLSREENTVFKLLKAALKENSDIKLFASPWSPPLFMKDNGKYQGGKLKKEFYGLWAKYVRKYIEEYAAKGIFIGAVTVQNELRHAQIWESCVFTKEEELELATEYLAKELKPLGVKIYIYDHCRERIFDRASYAFTKSKIIDGIACHWYSGDYFEELRMAREKFPDKEIIISEACVALDSPEAGTDDAWAAAERYVHDIIGDMNNGATAFCDWNLMLDEKRGPAHFRDNRPCVADASVICNKNTGEVEFRPAYYCIGHFSRFIKRGARILGFSKAWKDVELTAACNPDGEIIVVARNYGGIKKGKIRVDEILINIEMKANSLNTFVLRI